jgi:DNA-binding CsgD family transcriptional regulator
MQLGYRIDWEQSLGEIDVPTLVLHRVGDLVVPVRQARKLAQGIRRARYVELPGVDHLMWVGDQEAVLREVQSFVEGLAPSSPRSLGDPAELGLTAREVEVLRLVVAGSTNKQIAVALSISPKTAGVHVSSILAKLGVERRGGVAAAAHQLGLIDIADGV